MLWDSMNSGRQSVIPLLMGKNIFRDAPAIDVYTAANTGDYDVIYNILNR
jgi:hypothetical protein